MSVHRTLGVTSMCTNRGWLLNVPHGAHGPRFDAVTQNGSEVHVEQAALLLELCGAARLPICRLRACGRRPAGGAAPAPVQGS